MKKRKLLILTSLFCLLPILVGTALYSRLPEQVPTHWGLDGTPNGWSSREFAVFGLPCLMTALNLFLHICLEREPKRANMSTILRTVSQWIIPAVSILCECMILGSALGYPIHAETVIPCLVGALFLIIGNYLPKTKQNRTMGIRVKWTLDSEENWNRTHRLSGFLWVISGLGLMLGALLHALAPWLLAVILAAVILVPLFYSYQLHRNGI